LLGDPAYSSQNCSGWCAESGRSIASDALTATSSTVTSMRLETMRGGESKCSPLAPSR
jgi:hypothetical protein